MIEALIAKINELESRIDGLDTSEHFHPLLALGAAKELTIDGGAVTVTKSYHTIDTQGDTASDDLDTISGGSDGDLLIIRAASSARTVVCKDGTDNLRLEGDCTLDDGLDTLMLINLGGTHWMELSRSDNA